MRFASRCKVVEESLLELNQDLVAAVSRLRHLEDSSSVRSFLHGNGAETEGQRPTSRDFEADTSARLP